MVYFDASQKSVTDVLTQTASKLSQIQVSNELQRQKVDLMTSQTASKRVRESSEAIFKTIETLIPDVKKKSR